MVLITLWAEWEKKRSRPGTVTSTPPMPGVRCKQYTNAPGVCVPGANPSRSPQERSRSNLLHKGVPSMPALNRAQLIGHLGKDPETRFTPTGKKVTHFTVAITNRWKNKDGEAKEFTEWVNI